MTKKNSVNKMLSGAVTRLRGAGLVAEDLLPQCGLSVVAERRGDEFVEAVYDLDNEGKCLQVIAIPKGLLNVELKQ